MLSHHGHGVPVCCRLARQLAPVTCVVLRQVMLEYEGLSQTLFVVTGSALGMSVSLDYRNIPFGIVVPRNSVERCLTLHNTGDIGTRYLSINQSINQSFIYSVAGSRPM